MSWEILTVHAESDSRNTPRSKYTFRYIWLSLRKHSGNVIELLKNSKHNNLKPEQEAPIWVDSVATMSLQSIYQILMGVKEKISKPSAWMQFKMELRAYTTPTVLDICTVAVLFFDLSPFASNVYMRSTLWCVIRGNEFFLCTVKPSHSAFCKCLEVTCLHGYCCYLPVTY